MAIIQFEVHKLGQDAPFIDPNTFFMKGYFNYNEIDALIANHDGALEVLIQDDYDGSEQWNKYYTLQLQMDGDDFGNWMDYKIVSDSFVDNDMSG